MVRTYYILGGGITGSILAYELLKNGAKVTLIEKNDHLGGLTGSFTWHGIPIDNGPHIFHTPDKDIVAYWEKECKGLFVKKEHWSSNYKDGKYYPYPISHEMIDNLPNDLKKKIKSEMSNRDLSKLKTATNYYDYMNILVGPTLQKMFFINYPEKVWGMPTSKLDANWAPKRIQIRDKITPFYSGQWSAIGKDGCSTIFNHLKGQILKKGGILKLTEKISKINVTGTRILSIVTDRGQYQINQNDIIFNTLSITKMSSMLGIKSDLKFRGVLLAMFLVSGKINFPNKADFLYFDDKNIIFNRLTNHNSFISNPPKNKTVLMAEVTYSDGDSLSKESSESIISKVKSSLISLGYCKSSSIIDTKLIRLPEVYPLFFKDYRKELARVRTGLDSLNNMYTLGAPAEFSYSDMQVLVGKAIDLAKIVQDPIMQINNIDKSAPRLIFEKKIQIGKFTVGENNPAFLIAEIGLNHNGSLQRAKELIDKAIQAGADSVKLQTYTAENRIAKEGKTSKYVEKILGIEETDYEMLKKYELSDADTKALFNYASGRVMIFSTPFDIRSVELLESLKVDAYKIASFDIQNFPLLIAVAKTQKPIILSTGMSTLAEVEDALKTIIKEGNNKVILLHCTSAYPCPPEGMNIKAIDTMRSAFQLPVGLSDHVIGDTVSIAAVARGANVIEKHFTLDKNLEGPDHVLSLLPEEFDLMTKRIRLVENSLGDGIKQPNQIEYSTMLRFRKTLHAARLIKKNSIISHGDISLSGPAFGLSPKYFDFVVGRKAKSDIEKDQPITLNDI